MLRFGDMASGAQSQRYGAYRMAFIGAFLANLSRITRLFRWQKWLPWSARFHNARRRIRSSGICVSLLALHLIGRRDVRWYAHSIKAGCR